MKKVTYSCDICRDETPKDQLMGCNFRNMKEFKLDTAASTDGVHICMGCLRQLEQQLAQKPKDPKPYDAAAHAAAYP